MSETARHFLLRRIEPQLVQLRKWRVNGFDHDALLDIYNNALARVARGDLEARVLQETADQIDALFLRECARLEHASTA